MFVAERSGVRQFDCWKEIEAGDISGEQGLTLVELLVALGIIAILSAVAVPAIMADLPRQRLAKSARILMADLQWARHQAVATNRDWRIRFDLDVNRYRILDSGPDRVWGTMDDRTVRTVRLADYGSGVGFGFGAATQNWNGTGLSAGSQLTVATFNSRGLYANAVERSSYLTNSDNRYAYAVTISPGGGLRVRMYGVQGNWMSR